MGCGETWCGRNGTWVGGREEVTGGVVNGEACAFVGREREWADLLLVAGDTGWW